MVMSSACDYLTIAMFFVVFALPLTTLIPEFSICDIIPKVRVTRFHVYSQLLTWPQVNAAMVVLLIVFFCFFIEIRKRKMDDMVDSVLKVSQATNKSMEFERDRQAGNMRACVELLDANAEHYENLVLLHEELRRRNQQPPTIEISSSSLIN